MNRYLNLAKMCFAYLVKFKKKEEIKLLTTLPLVTTFVYITSHNLIINAQSHTTSTYILIFPKGPLGGTHQKSRKLNSSSLNTSYNICVDFWSQLHDYYS